MLEITLTIATIIGSIIGSIVGIQNIYKNHLEIKKLQKELQDQPKNDSS